MYNERTAFLSLAERDSTTTPSIESFAGKPKYRYQGGTTENSPRFTREGNYSESDIREHADYVRTTEANIRDDDRMTSGADDMKEFAAAMETFFTRYVKAVFGPDATALPVTRYTDLKQKTDLVVAFRNKDGSIRELLAVDFTFSQQEHVIESKIANQFSGVSLMKLRGLSYLYDPVSRTHFEASMVPAVTIPMSLSTVLSYVTRWQNNDGLAIFYESPERKALLSLCVPQLMAQRSMAIDHSEHIVDGGLGNSYRNQKRHARMLRALDTGIATLRSELASPFLSDLTADYDKAMLTMLNILSPTSYPVKSYTRRRGRARTTEEWTDQRQHLEDLFIMAQERTRFAQRE